MKNILILAFAFVVYLLLRNLFGARRYKWVDRSAGPGQIADDEMVKDPCCETYVPVSQAVKRIVNGETKYFCSPECAEKYQSDDRPMRD